MATVDYWVDGKLIQIDEDDPRAKHIPTDEQLAEAQKLLTKTKEEEIRNVRNTLLTESDWTQNSDVPESTRTKWQSYRQALRDITTHEKFPDTFDVESDFPTKPS